MDEIVVEPTGRAQAGLAVWFTRELGPLPAACAVPVPVGRSCPYGARENPVAVSQPMPASSGAASGSAVNDTRPATQAQATSTPAGVSRPPSPAAIVPVARNRAKPPGRAYGAGIARARRIIDCYFSRANGKSQRP